MSKKNHKKIDGKLLKLDKQVCHLKQAQKEKINESLYQEYRKECIENNNKINKNSFDRILHIVISKIESEQISISDHEIKKYFSSRKIRYKKRYEKELTNIKTKTT